MPESILCPCLIALFCINPTDFECTISVVTAPTGLPFWIMGLPLTSDCCQGHLSGSAKQPCTQNAWLFCIVCIRLAYKKSPDFSSRDLSVFISTIIKRWFQPFGLHTRSLTNCFVCNFLSSSTGFNLCSCFFRLTLVFYFRFRPFWAVHSTTHRRFLSAF